MDKKYLRIIDANFNRAKEALRVSEDFARLYFNDAKLSSALKRARHDVTKELLGFPVKYAKMVQSRDSVKDVGKNSSIQDAKVANAKTIMTANLKRSQESIRVLEELSKAISPKSSKRFQAMRFRLYDLEKRSLQKF